VKALADWDESHFAVEFALGGPLGALSMPMPAGEDAAAIGAFVSRRLTFNKFQRAYENALLAAI
jgi:hypothetical protein